MPVTGACENVIRRYAPPVKGSVMMEMHKICRFALLGIATFVHGLALGSDAVYLKPLGADETRETQDGASWATAYADVASAAAAAGATPIYAAQGVYVVKATVTLSAATTIYGGFPGLSDDETLADRDVEAYQTIITGDQALDDVWVHGEPSLTGYSATSTTLTGKVIENGRISPPPAYTGDYDCYYPSYKNTNTSTGFSVANGLTVDGVWFNGFSPSGNNGSVFEMKGGALNIHNCRFVGIKGGARASLHYNVAAGGEIRDSKFLWSTSTECCTFRHSNAASDLIVSNCVFESCYRSGLGTGGNVFYGRDRTILRDCVFARNVDVTTQAGNNYGGMGNLVGGDGSNPVFIDCIITNNFTASSGQYGSPLIARGRLIRGGLIANNRYQVKPVDGLGYALIGYASNTSSSHFVCDGVTFRGNQVSAVQVTASSGAYYLGLLGQNVVSSGNGQPFTVINCVFDSNAALAEHAPVTGLTPRLCRGPYAMAVVSGAKSQVGVANCTFTGPFAEDMYDVAQYGAGYGYDINIVNSIFTVTDADIAANWLYADAPTRIKAYSCTVKNLPAAPNGLGVCSEFETDDVPMNAGFMPQAKTPGLRVTADIATNALATASAAPTFEFRPFGSDTWIALMPAVATAVTVCYSSVDDMNGVVRPRGVFTRGAVQRLPETAEFGATLTLRRSPLASGTLTGAANAQSVVEGSAIVPVTAVPNGEQVQFDGWYGVDGTLYSTDNPLAIASLGNDLVLTAKFKAAATKLTFDLGANGTFVENGASTITVEAEYLMDFPQVPAYRLNDGLVLVGWGELPAKVPAADTTYTAKCVTTDVRIIRVTPEGAGRMDGSDWANAYGDFAAAYADAATYRGEVWMKEGVYTLSETVAVRANVTVRGGFTGVETSADEADPTAHPTIFTGDVNGDDFWQVNGSSPAAANRTPVISDGKVNAPNPDGADTYWAPGGNVTDNTKFGFSHADVNATNAVLSGLTIVSFETTAFSSSTLGGSGVRLENCRFVANNGGHYGDDANSADYEKGGVYVNGTAITFDHCTFEGNFWAVNVAATEPSTNVFADCAFVGNFGGAKAATMRIRTKMSAVFERCRFFRNCNNDEKHESATCIVFAGSACCRLSDCVFEGNRSRGNSHGMILCYGSAASAGGHLFERCRFLGNTSSVNGGYGASSAVFAGYSQDDSFLVRDSYFAGNVQDTTTSGEAFHSSVLSSNGGNWTFLNCTFETNRLNVVKDTAKGATFNCLNGSCALVNCSVVDSELEGAGASAEFRLAADGSRTLALINTAVGNPSEDYVPFLSDTSTMHAGLAASVIRNYDATVMPQTANSYLHAVASAMPSFAHDLKTGENGAWAIGLFPGSLNARGGVPVWLSGNTVYFRDEATNPSKPWRKAIDAKPYSASVAGLDENTPTIPDAFGAMRNLRHFAMGPVCVSSSGMAIICR